MHKPEPHRTLRLCTYKRMGEGVNCAAGALVLIVPRHVCVYLDGLFIERPAWPLLLLHCCSKQWAIQPSGAGWCMCVCPSACTLRAAPSESKYMRALVSPPLIASGPFKEAISRAPRELTLWRGGNLKLRGYEPSKMHAPSH